jgi:hypothetical protein
MAFFNHLRNTFMEYGIPLDGFLDGKRYSRLKFRVWISFKLFNSSGRFKL